MFLDLFIMTGLALNLTSSMHFSNYTLDLVITEIHNLNSKDIIL